MKTSKGVMELRTIIGMEMFKQRLEQIKNVGEAKAWASTMREKLADVSHINPVAVKGVLVEIDECSARRIEKILKARSEIVK